MPHASRTYILDPFGHNVTASPEAAGAYIRALTDWRDYDRGILPVGQPDNDTPFHVPSWHPPLDDHH